MILNGQRKNVEPGIVVLEMNGRIAMGSDSQKIEWKLAELLKENHKKAILDLTDVTYLDSSGIGILMMCHAKNEEGRRSTLYRGSTRYGRRNTEDYQLEQNCPLLSDSR